MNVADNPASLYFGQPLRYLIGTDDDLELQDRNGIVEIPYDRDTVPTEMIDRVIGYCNQYDEKKSGRYGPYLKPTDISRAYDEGVCDPSGLGFWRNLDDQFIRRRHSGITCVELDNPDAYTVTQAVRAIDYAYRAGFCVAAKNPGAMDGDALPIVQHPAIIGIIVEEGSGTPHEMQMLRVRAGKPQLMVWFVAFHHLGNARITARHAAKYIGMSVTWSRTGEYTSCADLLLPRT